MLKKILLPLLMAAVVLPQSVSAAIAPNGTSQARGMVAAQNSLSVSDRQAIKKLLITMEKSVARGDLKTLLTIYSPQYQSTGDGGSNYGSLKTRMRAGLALIKAYGIKFSINNIKIVNVEGNRANVSADYHFQLEPDVLAEMSESQRQQFKKMKTSSMFTVEKENGRWIIIAESIQDQRQETVATPAATAPAKNQQQERKILQALFKKHIQALNKEDLQAYLATLDPKSAQYKEAQAQTQKLFKEYDLKYEVETIEVISIGQQNAVVKMVATVKKIKGGSFADSKIIAYNTLRKTSQGWRIADTQIESVSALASR
jgi:ketosteroid isomerase-like protein